MNNVISVLESVASKDEKKHWQRSYRAGAANFAAWIDSAPIGFINLRWM